MHTKLTALTLLMTSSLGYACGPSFFAPLPLQDKVGRTYQVAEEEKRDPRLFALREAFRQHQAKMRQQGNGVRGNRADDC